MADEETKDEQEEIARAETEPDSSQSPPSGSSASFTITRAEYSGPIPPPGMLAQYNDIIPDGADRILKMAERQQENRIFLEQTTIKSDTQRSAQGLYTGATVATVGYLTSGFLGYTGHDYVAGIMATGITAGLVGVFVTGTYARQEERSKGRKSMKRLLEKRQEREESPDE